LHGGENDAGWTTVLEKFAALRDQWLRHGVLRVLQEVMADRDVAERLLPLPDGDRRLTNLRHVTELIHATESTQHLGVDGVLRSIAGWRAGTNTDDEAGAEITQLRLETDAQAVQIITVHGSKGLQYDLVFCPTLWNGRKVAKPPFFVETDEGRVFDLGSPDVEARKRKANAARLAEDLRLLYVALTRARFRTYVTWTPMVAKGAKETKQVLENDGAVHSALGYLLCHDSELDECAYEDASEQAAQLLTGRRPIWRDDLHAMASGNPGIMAVTDALHVDRLELWQPEAAPRRSVAARTLPENPAPAMRFQTYSIGSFTSLARNKGASERDDVIRDRDDDAEDAGETHGATGGSLVDLPPSDFRAFPAGRRAGTLLHMLFEQSRFDDTREILQARVSALLQKARIAGDEQDPQIGAVVTMMQDVFTVPWTLPASTQAVRLCDVPHRAATHEWQFLLPCAQADRPLTTARLVQCFGKSADPTERRYAAYLQTLSASQLDGYLQGFVDLVFEVDDCWYVVDWKSNKQPLSPDSYAQDALEVAMHGKHYTLQATLYVVALHRFLRTRLANYDYDRHIGGYAYAYLRGFVPGASSTGHGWYTHRPSRTLIAAIDAILDGNAGTGGSVA
jgi:exodeoxyribonuclease V beta subunit